MAEDKEQDHNRFHLMLVTKFSLKTLFLIVLMLNVSFFFGVIWLIYCEVTERAFNANSEEDSFITRFLEGSSVGSASKVEVTIKLVYFIFTTLSTVGFGDMSPQAPRERLLGAFLLLFAVLIFSLVMATFSEILVEFQNYNKGLD